MAGRLNVSFLVALGALGGPTRAALLIGVSKGTLLRWLNHGLKGARPGPLIRLAELSGIALAQIQRWRAPTATERRWLSSL